LSLAEVERGGMVDPTLVAMLLWMIG
jgi:hypothetical protein